VAFRTYRKRLWLMPNPAVRAEIASLDPTRDCERIVHLLTAYEFPFDIQRSLELALFHTYGSTSVAALLDRTAEFRYAGQKRYDDTRLLISQFMESGVGAGLGGTSVARMNEIHAFFRIPNDDFLFVLWTFISYPQNWIADFGWRPLTWSERHAWFTFFLRVGERMGLADIPQTYGDFERFASAYEATYLVYADANRRVADDTVAIFAGWFPPIARFLVQPVVTALIPGTLIRAFGYRPPPVWLKWTVRRVLAARAFALRFVTLEPYPSLLTTTRNLTYPGNTYEIEALGPDRLAGRSRASAGG
jgi:hypothetical protein